MTVTVLLDGEESTIEFIDPPDRNVSISYWIVFIFTPRTARQHKEHSSYIEKAELTENRHLRVSGGPDSSPFIKGQSLSNSLFFTGNICFTPRTSVALHGCRRGKPSFHPISLQLQLLQLSREHLHVDLPVISGGVEQLMDAFVVVFAINEHASFEVAQNLVRFLRVDYGTDRAILLVANKIDLVRKRKVTADEARLVATTFDCKYVETSAALNHYVDELLVGIISQIRLQLSIPFTTIFFPGKEAGKRRKSKKPLCKGPRGFLNKLFRRGGFGNHGGKKDKAVDDLYTL
ncbi:hypothetical protein C0Q70_19452 [Pomacea canaliculata]|uniref:Small monomeric GTPase n=1 Tax=Pomacea canaliculata TaxID=400727 RepID=A0A2T7NJD8_POMCA|nr:hypothetical protein C0Q70_19452 [Pomacea canaliculata]